MATIPFSYECVREAGFLPNPNQHNRVGYVTALNGFGIRTAFTPDLAVHSPIPNPAHIKINPIGGKLNVVGVIEKFEWNGGVGDFISLDFWVSQQTATQLKAAQQQALRSTAVNQLGWWIADYDQETKAWYEQAYPGTSSGLIAGIVGPKDNPELNIDLSPVPAKDGIDVLVYKISIQVAPGASQSAQLRFSPTAGNSVFKQWGLVVGALAQSRGL